MTKTQIKTLDTDCWIGACWIVVPCLKLIRLGIDLLPQWKFGQQKIGTSRGVRVEYTAPESGPGISFHSCLFMSVWAHVGWPGPHILVLHHLPQGRTKRSKETERVGMTFQSVFVETRELLRKKTVVCGISLFIYLDTQICENSANWELMYLH